MTDNEIIKALECFKSEDCLGEKCPYYEQPGLCGKPMCSDVYDFIYRQKAEIERLTDSNRRLRDDMRMMLNNHNGNDQIRAEAIKEFWASLKEIAYLPNLSITGEYVIDISDGDNLVKEMTEQSVNYGSSKTENNDKE